VVAAKHPTAAQAVQDELANVLMYLVRLSGGLGVDLNEAVTSKHALNNQKYPTDKAKSTSIKYNQLRLSMLEGSLVIVYAVTKQQLLR